MMAIRMMIGCLTAPSMEDENDRKETGEMWIGTCTHAPKVFAQKGPPSSPRLERNMALLIVCASRLARHQSIRPVVFCIWCWAPTNQMVHFR